MDTSNNFSARVLNKMNSFQFHGILFFTITLGTNCTKNATVNEINPPNVIIIFADDLGYGDVGCYGATKVKTPHIDKLAEQGRLFTDAHSASAVCTPSRYAILTGRYPFREGLYSPKFHSVGLLIDTSQLTIADVMKESGYSTACIGKWHLGFGVDTPDWNGDLKPGPLELGFDYYYGVPVVNSHPPFVYVENHRVVGLDPNDPFVPGQIANTKEYPEKVEYDALGGAEYAHSLYEDELIATRLTEKAVEWIKQNEKKTFFLYYATTNIHHPFTPHPRFQGTSDCGRYGDFIHEMDWIIGEIVNVLEELKLAENTLLIFTSDNGGMLNQGGQDAWQLGHRMNGDLFGFKFDAWEGGHRVPFIAKWPAKIPSGSTSNQLISNIDLLSTLASITGFELKEGQGPDSYNMISALLDQPETPIRDHLVLAPNNPKQLALRDGEWMLISGQGGGGFMNEQGTNTFGGPATTLFTGRTNSDIENGMIKPDAPAQQLYNLRYDLEQSRNVILEYPEIAEKMEKKLSEIKNREHTRSN